MVKRILFISLFVGHIAGLVAVQQSSVQGEAPMQEFISTQGKGAAFKMDILKKWAIAKDPYKLGLIFGFMPQLLPFSPICYCLTYHGDKTEAECALEITGFCAGAATPLGSLYVLSTLADRLLETSTRSQ